MGELMVSSEYVSVLRWLSGEPRLKLLELLATSLKGFYSAEISRKLGVHGVEVWETGKRLEELGLVKRFVEERVVFSGFRRKVKVLCLSEKGFRVFLSLMNVLACLNCEGKFECSGCFWLKMRNLLDSGMIWVRKG